MKNNEFNNFSISSFLLNHIKREANKLLPNVEDTNGALYAETPNKPPVTPVYGDTPVYLLPRRPPV